MNTIYLSAQDIKINTTLFKNKVILTTLLTCKPKAGMRFSDTFRVKMVFTQTDFLQTRLYKYKKIYDGICLNFRSYMLFLFNCSNIKYNLGSHRTAIGVDPLLYSSVESFQSKATPSDEREHLREGQLSQRFPLEIKLLFSVHDLRVNRPC